MNRPTELKHHIRTLLARSAGVAAGALLPGLAFAGPTGEVVVAGAVSVDRPDLNTTVVTQGTQSAIVNWTQFNVGGQELVQFVQPSSSAVILNRVIGNDPTQIFGSISANGHVFLVNTRGVYFSPTAQLDVQGLFASTLDIGDADFGAGNYAFARAADAPDAGVVNDGALVARDGGYVVLAGDWAENTGVIAANAGHVVLAAGSRLTLDLAGDGLVNFAVDEATLAGLAGARNSGTLSATGGTVVMTARVANALTATAVNNSGTIEARSIEERGGEVWLVGSGGAVAHSGTIDVSGHDGAAGGLAVVYGTGDVTLAAGAVINAGGAAGGEIRVIAEERFDFQEGATLTAAGAEGAHVGGMIEVSGHGGLTLRGVIDVGTGGEILIDPSAVNIIAGGSFSSAGISSSVFVGFIEAQLNAGNDVKILASNTINAGGSVTSITGTNTNGDLFLEIGTSAPTCAVGPVQGICVNTFGSFTPTTGGTINLGGVDISIAGNLQVQASQGAINLGDVTAATLNATINPTNNFTAGNLTATAGDISITAVNNVTVGDLDAANNVSITATGGISISGNVTLGSAVAGGNLVVTANAGSFGGGNVTMNGAGSAGGLLQLNAIGTTSPTPGGGGNVMVFGDGAGNGLRGSAVNVTATTNFTGTGPVSGTVDINGDVIATTGAVDILASNAGTGPGGAIQIGNSASLVSGASISLVANTGGGGFGAGRIELGSGSPESNYLGATVNATAGDIHIEVTGGDGVFVAGDLNAAGAVIVDVLGAQGHIHLGDYAGGVITGADVVAGGIVDLAVTGDVARIDAGDLAGQAIDLDATGTGGAGGNATIAIGDATATGAGSLDDVALRAFNGTPGGNANVTAGNLNAAGNLVDVQAMAGAFSGSAGVTLGDVNAGRVDVTAIAPDGAGIQVGNVNATATAPTPVALHLMAAVTDSVAGAAHILTGNLTGSRIDLNVDGTSDADLTIGGTVTAFDQVVLATQIDFGGSLSRTTNVSGGIALTDAVGGNLTINGGNVQVSGLIDIDGSAAVANVNGNSITLGDIDMAGGSLYVQANALPGANGLVDVANVIGRNVTLQAIGPAGANVNFDGIAATGNVTVTADATGPSASAVISTGAGGGIAAAGTVFLTADAGSTNGFGSISMFDVTAANLDAQIIEPAPSGQIIFGTVTASNIDIDTHGGTLFVNGIVAIDSTAPVTVFLSADATPSVGGNITVGSGGILAEGQGGGTGPVAADVQLVTAGNGNITVNGAVSVTGNAGAYSFTTPHTQFGSAGYVNFNAQAGSNGALLMTGGLDVAGVGIVNAHLAGRTVNVSGPITVTATPETLNLNRTFPACSSIVPGCSSETVVRTANLRGAGSLNVSGLMGTSTAGVNLGDVTVTGPFATVNVSGSNLNVGNLTVDGSGRVDMRSGSLTVGGVPRTYADQDTLGQALIRLDAGTGPGSQIITGDLSASGVGIAEIRVYANNISTGALTVAALASDFTHSGSTFGRFRRGFTEFPDNGPVTLLEGTQHLGVATVEMGALIGPPSSASLVAAASVFIGGTVDVDGVGFATLRLRADNIAISGDANVTATAGSQAGTGLDASSNPVSYTATGGHAVVDLAGLSPFSGTFDLANVTVDGPTSAIVINNVANVVNTGNLTAAAGTQTVDVGGAAIVKENDAIISINTGVGVAAGDLTAEALVFVSGGASTVLGDITAPQISVSGDDTTVGALTAVSSVGPVSIFANAFNNLFVNGAVTAEGVQDATSPVPAVEVVLSLGNSVPSGGVTVTGPIFINAIGANYAYSFASGEGSHGVVDAGFAGTAHLQLSANAGTISAGSITVNAVGAAQASFLGDGGVTLGPIAMNVAAASFNRVDTFNCFGSCSVTRTTVATQTGHAFLEIQGDNGVVNVGAMNVTGPQVFVGITGKDVNVAGLTLVGTGVTETVGSTGTASSGAETVSFDVSRDGGAVQLNVEALPGSTSGHINITGALSATGIGHVVVGLAADHVVTQAVTLDAAAGSFTRSGARFTGGPSDLSAFFDPFGPTEPDSPLPGIDAGTVIGGRANLSVFGGFASSCEGSCGPVAAQNVTLGAVSVTADGNASVRIDATGFVNVTGPVSITGGLAQVNGTGVETFFDTSVGSNVTLSRTVAASHGQGALYINGGASSVALGDVTVAGPVAEVEIEGGGNVFAGAITLTGTGGTIQVDEHFDYAGTLGTDFDTQFIGPGLPTAVGVHAPGTVSLGQVAVDGVGIVGVFVDGGDVFVAGIDASAAAGGYSLLDTRNSPTPTVATLGDVALSVFEGSCGPTSCTVTGPATITGDLAVVAARDVSLGVVANVTGQALIQATGGQVSGDVDPLVDVIAGLRDDGPPEPTVLVSTDLSAAGLFIFATGDVLLDDAALFANPLSGAGVVVGDAAALAHFGLSPADPNLYIGAGGNVDLGVVEAVDGSYVWLDVGGNLAPLAAGGGIGIGIGSVLQISRGGGFTVDQSAGGAGVVTAVEHLDPLGGTYVVLGGSTQTGDITIGANGLALGSRELAVITDGNVLGGSGAVVAAGITLDAGASGMIDLVTSTGQITLADGATASINNNAFTGAVSLDITASGHDAIDFATGGDAFVFGSFSGVGLIFDVAGGLTIDSAYTATGSISLAVGTYLATAGDTITAGTLNLDGGASTDFLLSTDVDTLNVGTADAVSIGNTGALTVDFDGAGYGSVGIGATGTLTLADGVSADSAAFNGANLVLNGDVTTVGTVNLTTGGTLTATGTLTASVLTVDGGVGTNLDLVTDAGTIALTEVDGTATIDNTAFTGSALLDISGATLAALDASFGGDAFVSGGLTGSAIEVVAAGNLGLSGNYSATGNVSLQTGSFFSLSGGVAANTLNLTGSGTDFSLTTDVSAVNVTGATSLVLDNSAATGGLSVTAGGVSESLDVVTGGALTLTGTFNGLALALDGTSLALGAGGHTAAGGMQLTTDGALTATGTLAAGALEINGAAGTSLDLATSTGTVVVTGIGGTLGLDNTAFTGSAALDFSGAGAAAVDAAFGGNAVVVGDFTGTDLTLDAAGALDVIGTYTATGAVSLATGGAFSYSGLALGADSLTLDGASANFALATAVANLNVIAADAVSIDNTGALGAAFGGGAFGDVSLTASGALAVDGGFDATSLVLDGTSLTLGDGTYTVAGGLTLVSAGTVADGANAEFAAGGITLDGAATTDWSLDIDTSSLTVLGGDTVQIDNLNTGTTVLAFGAPVGAVDMVFAGGFVLATDLTATSLIVDAGQLATGDAVLAGRTVTTTGFLAVSTLNGGDIDVTDATLTAGGLLALNADGDVFDDGSSAAAPAALSQAALVASLSGASVLVSGDNIRLGGTTVAIGAGTADPSLTDALVFDNLADADFTVPSSTVANGAFLSRGELALGAVDMTGGDYLMLQGDSLALNGAITGPASLLVQITTGTPGGSISVENTAGTAATLNLDVATLTQIADGTVVLGRGGSGSTIGNSGAIDLGVNGAIDLNGLDLLVVTTGPVSALGNVTGGLVVSLAELLAPPIEEPTPILDDIDPDALDPEAGIDTEAGTGESDEEEEEDDEGEDTEDGTVDESQDDDSLIKQETAAPVGVCGVGTGG